MELRSNTLQVVGEHEEELSAHAVDVHLTVEGSSTFTGRAALSKAKEVAALVQALAQAGVPESALDLTSVRVEVKSGLLGKSSSATYGLRVQVQELERLPSVLGAISAAARVSLDRLHWRYPDDDATESRMLQAATRRAVAKAEAIAAALNLKLAEVAAAEELRVDEAHEHVVRFGAPAMVMRARGSAEEADLGMDIQHRRKTKRQVRLSYRTETRAPAS